VSAKSGATFGIVNPMDGKVMPECMIITMNCTFTGFVCCAGYGQGRC